MSHCCSDPTRKRRFSYLPAIIIAIAFLFVVAQGAPPTPSEAAIKTADQFAEAIAAGDQSGVQALLLPKVLIYESGSAETSAEEYAGHHLPADIAFMAAMTRTVIARQSGGDGNTQWVATQTRLKGRYKEREIDLDSTESLILLRGDSGWRIAHVHWSSTPHEAVDH